jgi:transposase
MVSTIAIMDTIVSQGQSRPRRPRRDWDDAEKLRIVAETRAPGVSVSSVARRYDMNANLLFTWLRDPRFNGAVDAPKLLAVDIAPEAAADDLRPAPSPSPSPSPWRIEIELPSGVRVRCGADVDAAALERVIAVLGRRRA